MCPRALLQWHTGYLEEFLVQCCFFLFNRSLTLFHNFISPLAHSRIYSDSNHASPFVNKNIHCSELFKTQPLVWDRASEEIMEHRICVFFPFIKFRGYLRLCNLFMFCFMLLKKYSSLITLLKLRKKYFARMFLLFTLIVIIVLFNLLVLRGKRNALTIPRLFCEGIPDKVLSQNDFWLLSIRGRRFVSDL